MGDTAKQNFHLATDPLFGGAAANEEIFHEHEPSSTVQRLRLAVT